MIVNTPNISKNRCKHPAELCKIRGGTYICDSDLCIVDEAYERLLSMFHTGEAINKELEFSLNLDSNIKEVANGKHSDA